ncbi:hypothetical protein EIJ81_00265 (plasmid) [Aliivibrio salmonicida]|uniref:hypothetical protein n=1 Tax=Aliivibrio salmonicida TaxID=40269 RepID=UPI000F7047AD|nr:hypothetical protein [Aliivibrio salmonicida]AZL83336.1 hypothetical protein EIJ81_00265 [Aliivibrio salmonicida]
MKKSILALSVATLFTTNVFAVGTVFNEAKSLLPNESVQSFEMADINNDGVAELVFVTVNGELKYAQQSGSGLLNQKDLDVYNNLNSNSTFVMDKKMEGTTSDFTSVSIAGGTLSLLDKYNLGCQFSLSLKDGYLSGSRRGNHVKLSFISDKKIVGTASCINGKFNQKEEIPFVAVVK